MAQTRVNIAVTIGTLAALGGSWVGVTRADVAAAAAKAALAADEASLSSEPTSSMAGTATTETGAVAVAPSGLTPLPDLSTTLGAAPAVQLPPLPQVTLGASAGLQSAGSAGSSTLVPAPPATAPVVSAPAAAPAAAAPATTSAPAAPVAAAPAPVVAPKAATTVKKTKAS